MTAPRSRWYPVAILLIVLLSFGLRLRAIDRQDIWGDEAFSIWLSKQPLQHVVAGGADTHPPLYPLLLYAWMPLAGTSPLAVRFLSALIGTLTIPAIYVLGRATLGAATALVAALLAAASPLLVYYSQETRMYGLVLLLSVLTVYWAARLVRAPDRDGTTACWAYLLSAMAAAYTHYYALFVILAVNLVVIPALYRRRPRALLGWFLAQLALAIAYLPWVAVQSGFLGAKASARLGEWDLVTAWSIVGQTAVAFAAGLAVPPVVATVFAAAYLVVAVLGLVVMLRRRRVGDGLILAYLFVPLVAAWVVNPIMPFFYPRYLLLIAPAFYLLVASGVRTAHRLWKPLGVVAMVSLLVANTYALRGTYADQTYAKGRYGQMMAYIEANSEPADGLLLANQLQRPIFEYYEPGGLDAYFFPHYDYALEDPRTALELESIAARHPRLWLVRYGNPAEYDPSGYLDRWLSTHGSKAYFGGWVDADLALYVMSSAPGQDAAEHDLEAALGDGVELVGYTLGSERVSPGGTLLLTLFWRATAPLTERYTVFTHLLDADGRIQGQMDSEPQGGGLPTDRWLVGELVRDNYALTVSPQAGPGPHQLEVGMYLLATGTRLPVRHPTTGELLGDRVLLGTVEVVAP